MSLKNYLATSLIVKFYILCLFIMLFDFFIGFLFFIVVSLIVFLFNKKEQSEANYRTVDSTLFLSPVEGVVSSDKSNSLQIKVPFYKNFGISMPIEGNIVSYFETIDTFINFGLFKLYNIKVSLSVHSSDLGTIKMKYSHISFVGKSNIWVRPGDIALRGAHVGYLPFGGKVVIEFVNNLKLLVKNKSNVQALRTILASNGQ